MDLRTSGAWALLLLAGTVPARAQVMRRPATSHPIDAALFRANVRPALSLRPATGPIAVDGHLDDPGWEDAAVATSFSETYPDDQAVPPIGIEAWMTYDEEHLYVAFVIADDPARVRANLSDRDAIWQDDYVGMMLDPYGDNAWAYFLASNPLGIQGDSRLVNGGHEDVGFDVVFRSEGRLTETGYQVEMAVPFRSLRFPERDVQQWSVNFWITHPRDSRATYSWAAMDRDDPCWMCQFGSVSGLAGVRPGGRIEWLPALTGSQAGVQVDPSDPTAGLDNDRLSTDPSLGLKYSFSSNAIADVAVNPDFSQIESDAAQIDVNTTFALFFPERRPFFQEGSDLYMTPISQVYTRSINNPSAVSKFTGRFGRTSVGYMSGLDEDTPVILPFEDGSMFATAGQSFSNVVRLRQTIGSASYVGGLVTDRRYLDRAGSGSTVGVDGRIRLSQTVSLEGQVVVSRTEEPTDPDLLDGGGSVSTFGAGHTPAFDGESYTGLAGYLSLERRGRYWFVDADYWTAGPTFRAANGFVTQNNLHRTQLVGGYTFYFEDAFVERLTPHVVTGYRWNHDGQRKDEFVWMNLEGQLKGQTRFQARMLLNSNEFFRGQDFRGLRRVEMNAFSNFSDPVRLGVGVSYGRSIARNVETPEMGRSLAVGFEGAFRPWTRFKLESSVEYFRLTSEATGQEYFEGYVLRNRLNYQFTRKLFLRVVTQYNDFSRRLEIDPLITYRVNPFTAVYVGSTHDFRDYRVSPTSPVDGFYQTERQFFFKLQYLLRM